MHFIPFLLTLLCFPSNFQGNSAPPDLASVNRELGLYRNELQSQRTDSKSLSRIEIQRKVAEFLSPRLSGINVDAIPEKNASEWAELFTEAGLNEKSLKLSQRAVDYHNVQLMFSDMNIVPALVGKGQFKEVLHTLRHAPDENSAMLGMISQGFLGACRKSGYDKSNPAFVQKGLWTLLNKVDLDSDPKSMAEYVYVDLSMQILEIKDAVNPRPSVLTAMHDLRARFANSESKNAFGERPSQLVDRFFELKSAVGKPAPALNVDRSIGHFAGLNQLKGKVVLLDFMAHWCGPCKAAIPFLAKLQSSLGSKGLQVVSLTSFYGYFGAKQKISIDEEFQLMHGFIDTYHMNWPVVFDAKQTNQQHYLVEMIPELVVIDQKGNIVQVQVGNTPEGESEVQATIERLLKEESPSKSTN